MIGLSSDIELAVGTILDGLELPIEIEVTDDDKIKRVMDSKVSSFKYSKELLDKWQKSPNAPSEDKMRMYVERLVTAGDSSIITLRQALGKKIDYESIEQTKISEAVKAKSTIYQYITQLDTGLMELRLMLDDNKFNLADREFKLGFPERYARGDFYNLDKYHNDWFIEEDDSIMLCANGTKGETIDVFGLKVTLPKKPKKSEILFSTLPKKEQYWRRQDLPSGLVPDSEDAFSEYIYEEYRRRREGIWFMNNGEAVYLTGDMYFALQWCKMKDKGGTYMDFRYAQRDMFYFAKACILDPRCLGQIFVKARRTGFTYVSLAIMLNDSTSTQNGIYGMTSQNDTDAGKTFAKYAYMLRNLPFFFRPVVKGAMDSNKEFEFGKPSDKSKATKLARKNDSKDYLNTYIDYESTKDGSYDGQWMKIYLGDEASKWKKPANYLNHWGRVSPTMDESGEIVGKALIGSTVNPMKQGGMEFKTLAFSSKFEDRDEITGRTPSGLYLSFLPAHMNMSKFTDKYGVCHYEKPEKPTYNATGKLIKTGSIEYLKAIRKAKRAKSEIAYNEELRANPMDLLEAFRDEAKSNIFPLEKITEQYQYNETSIILDQHVTRGNFMWKDGVKDTEVDFYPDPKGRFLVSWIPPKHMRNNKKKNSRGIWEPMNAHIGCFGADTYDISGTVSGKGSKGALSGVTGFTMEDAPSNTFFLEYINRTELAETCFEDMLMALVFYGMPVLAENNKPRFLYHLKNRGYRGFSLTRPDKPANKLSPTEREIGGIPSSSKDVITTHASMIENFIVNFVGIYTEQEESKRVREFGSMGNMFMQETLDDWLAFDITDREKSDATISSGYALMGLHRATLSPIPELKPINMGMSTYSQSGARSKLKK
ncbi:terminase large subunit [Maribacter phage Panino]